MPASAHDSNPNQLNETSVTYVGKFAHDLSIKMQLDQAAQDSPWIDEARSHVCTWNSIY